LSSRELIIINLFFNLSQFAPRLIDGSRPSGAKSDPRSHDFARWHSKSGTGDLFAEDANLRRCFYSQADLIPVDLDDRHHDSAVNDNFLVQLAAQYQHGILLLAF
jgi:hypothetical protein